MSPGLPLCSRVCACGVSFFPWKAILSYTKRKPPIDFYFKELSKPSEIDKKRDFVFTKPPQMMLTFINSVYTGKNRTFEVLLYRWALAAQKYDFLLALSHTTTFWMSAAKRCSMKATLMRLIDSAFDRLRRLADKQVGPFGKSYPVTVTKDRWFVS